MYGDLPQEVSDCGVKLLISTECRGKEYVELYLHLTIHLKCAVFK
jgi:hypothetical protein